METESFYLIETIYWKEKGAGHGSFHLLDYHLKRMASSANYFGFPFEKERFLKGLEDTKKRLLAASIKEQVVRVTMDSSGLFNIECLDVPSPPRTPVRIDISEQKVDSLDIYLYHKTSERNLFDLERKRLEPLGLFETLFINERGELTQGTITNLFLDTGERFLLTPALHCGLLPGTLRQYLLDKKKAKEAILTPNDLISAKRILVGNSVRGLLEAVL